MNQVELLRHVVDNIEAGRPAGYGLLYNGVKCEAKYPSSIAFNRTEPYSLAPKTVIINGIEVERGVDVAPESGRFYIPLMLQEGFAMMVWTGVDSDFKLMKKGIVFTEKEKAIAMAKAMLNFQDV